MENKGGGLKCHTQCYLFKCCINKYILKLIKESALVYFKSHLLHVWNWNLVMGCCIAINWINKTTTSRPIDCILITVLLTIVP